MAVSSHPRNCVRALSRRTLPCAAERAIAAVQDIQSIERTEVKADRVVVSPDSPTSGTYAVSGHFARVPWTSRFAYDLHSTGFHSVKLRGERPHSWEISGGFIVAPLGELECLVVHYEDYGLPRWLAPLRAVIRLYLHRSMRVELDVLAEIVAGEPA